MKKLNQEWNSEAMEEQYNIKRRKQENKRR